jgi:hypothetical protein
VTVVDGPPAPLVDAEQPVAAIAQVPSAASTRVVIGPRRNGTGWNLRTGRALRGGGLRIATTGSPAVHGFVIGRWGLDSPLLTAT